MCHKTCPGTGGAQFVQRVGMGIGHIDFTLIGSVTGANVYLL
jgi:hypothetical protein